MEGKKVFLFDPQTGEYKGSYVAQPCPVNDGEFITPTDSTEDAPPVADSGTAVVWTGAAWLLVPDHRGEPVYEQATGKMIECDRPGDLPAGWALTPPPLPFDVQQANKRAEIDRAWASANMTTFEYGDYVVGCDQIDRMNIDGVAGHIALFNAFPDGFPGVWKARDRNGVTALIPMESVGAFRTMYAAMTAQGAANFTYAQLLKDQISGASSSEELQAIAW